MNRWLQFSLLLSTIAILGGLAFVHGGFATWFLLVIVVFLFTLGWLLHTLALQGLSLQREVVRSPASGNPLRIRLVLTRGRRIPLAWLLLTEEWVHEGSGRRYRITKLVLPGWKRRFTEEYAVTGLPRGKYKLSGSLATAGDFFGIFSRQCSLPLEGSFRVYPSPRVPGSGMMPDSPGWRQLVSHIRARGAESPVVKSVREYNAGDPVNRIDWKRYPSKFVLQTKEMEKESSLRVKVMLDLSPGQETDAFEAAVEAAAGLMLLGEREAADIVLADGNQADGGRGCKGRQAMDWLADAWPAEGIALRERLLQEGAVARKGTAWIWITSRLTETNVRTLVEWCGKGHAVSVAYVSATPVLSWHDRQYTQALERAGCRFYGISGTRAERGGKANETA